MENKIISIHDDGKGKHHSFEAWIKDVDIERGYGETESQAIQDYMNNIAALRDSLTEVLDCQTSFGREKVNWEGKTI